MVRECILNYVELERLDQWRRNASGHFWHEYLLTHRCAVEPNPFCPAEWPERRFPGAAACDGRGRARYGHTRAADNQRAHAPEQWGDEVGGERRFGKGLWRGSLNRLVPLVSVEQSSWPGRAHDISR